MRRVDLITMLCVAPVLCSLVWAIGHARRSDTSDPRFLLDAERQRTIHTAMLLFSGNDITRALPTPGRINRFTDPVYGRVPYAGQRNFRKNSTGHLFSALIAQRYLDPAVLISPGEANPVVAEFGAKEDDAADTYDYDAYQPADDIYWMGDTADPLEVSVGTPPIGYANQIFRAKINRPVTSNGKSHVSYAHLTLDGQRRAAWSAFADHTTVHLGTRGTKNGITVGDEFDLSPTLGFFGPPNVWMGNICRGDGRVEALVVASGGQFGLEGVTYTCTDTTVSDNIFEAEFSDCGNDLEDGYQQGDARLAQSEVVVEGSDGNPKVLAYYDYRLEATP